MFQNVLNEILKYDKIIIHRHSNPDGDALGSQIGLKNIIKLNFPQKTVYAVGDDAGSYSFMEDSAADIIDDSEYDDALAIILDSASAGLISDCRYTTAAKTVRIDHHIFCEKIADIEVIDTSFESCCGMIAEFARSCSLKLSPLAAKSIYTGIVTDSGRFRYDSTSSRTLSLASYLLEQPFDPAEIYSALYSEDYDSKRLRAQFILKIKFTPKNAAYIYTDYNEFLGYNTSAFNISRGMVNTMADIKGVDIWVNFTEMEDSVLCELRSSKYNINPIAVKYGGGGHKKASGATLKDKAQVMSMLDDIDKMIGEAQ